VVVKQVCANGLVSFGSSITSSTGSIPRNYGPPFIAANWYYFRIYSYNYYNKGRVYYRSTSSGDFIAHSSLLFLSSYEKNKEVVKETRHSGICIISPAAHWMASSHVTCIQRTFSGVDNSFLSYVNIWQQTFSSGTNSD